MTHTIHHTGLALQNIETAVYQSLASDPLTANHIDRIETLIAHADTCYYGGDNAGAKQYAIDAAAMIVRFIVEKLEKQMQL